MFVAKTVLFFQTICSGVKLLCLSCVPSPDPKQSSSFSSSLKSDSYESRPRCIGHSFDAGGVAYQFFCFMSAGSFKCREQPRPGHLC